MPSAYGIYSLDWLHHITPHWYNSRCVSDSSSTSFSTILVDGTAYYSVFVGFSYEVWLNLTLLTSAFYWNWNVVLIDQQLGVKILYSHEKEPLGTGTSLFEISQPWNHVAGPLALAKDILIDGHPEEPFFVLNSDVTSTFPLKDLLAFHQSHGKEGTIMVLIFFTLSSRLSFWRLLRSFVLLWLVAAIHLSLVCDLLAFAVICHSSGLELLDSAC